MVLFYLLTVFVVGSIFCLFQHKSVITLTITDLCWNLPFVMESLVMEKNHRLIALVYPDYDSVDESGLSHDNLALIMAVFIQ